MFSKGDELYDKRFGERYLVLEAARDSGGEFVRIEDTAAPCSLSVALACISGHLRAVGGFRRGHGSGRDSHAEQPAAGGQNREQRSIQRAR